MLEVKWLWKLGAVGIATGIALLMLSWITVGIGCGDPVPGCRTLYNWPLALLGTLLAVTGLGLLTYECLRIARKDADAKPLLFLSGTAFVVSLLVMLIVFNPLISPYSFIRDSDLDGYTDDIDNYPDDASRHYTTYLQAVVEFQNTSGNMTIVITDLWVHVMDAPPTTDSLFLEVGEYSTTYYDWQMDVVGNLAEINGTWVLGIRYIDNVPCGMLSVNDTITADTAIYPLSLILHVTDDHGYLICPVLGW